MLLKLCLLATVASGFFLGGRRMPSVVQVRSSVVENESPKFDDIDVTEIGPAPEEVLDEIILGLERQLRIERGDEESAKKRSFVDSRKAARADIFSTIELTRKAEGDTTPLDVSADYFAQVSGFVENDDDDTSSKEPEASAM